MKLNYLHFIINFWKQRRKKRITNLQADLYFFLVQECNQQDWENPFFCSNGTIGTSIGISEKSLIDARNRLKQLGLIEFEGGVTKQKAPLYYLLDYWNKVSIEDSIEDSIVGGIAGGKKVNIINKPNQTETKPNQNPSVGKPPEKKKDGIDKTLYWKKLVESWFEFYKKNYSIEPSFTGAAGKHLKSIVDRLKKLSEERSFEWTEENATRALTHFLTKAHSVDWLRNNFLLTNLSSQFDKIVNPKNDGTTKNGQQPTGAAVSTESAFNKIDALSSQNGERRN